MKLKIITYLTVFVLCLNYLPVQAQITRTTRTPYFGTVVEQQLSGTVYKVPAQKMNKYRENALTVMRNFYTTLPDCRDLDVKENFIENMMTPESLFKVDFYRTSTGKNEFLSPAKYILEFEKEYAAELDREDEITLELSDIKYDDHLVHPEDDELAALLQLHYTLTIRCQDKVLKTARSSAVCYYPSRTDFRTCKVRQIKTGNTGQRRVVQKRTIIKYTDKLAEQETKSESAGQKVTESAQTQPYRFLHKVKKGQSLKIISDMYGITVKELMAANPGINKKGYISVRQMLRIPYPPGARVISDFPSREKGTDFVTTTHHPDFEISRGAIGYYKNQKKCTIDLLLENKGNKDVVLRAYANMYESKFKLRAVDNEGNIYEDVIIRLGNRTDFNQITLPSQTFVKLSVDISSLSPTATSIRLLEWEMNCNAWGIFPGTPVTIRDIPLP